MKLWERLRMWWRQRHREPDIEGRIQERVSQLTAEMGDDDFLHERRRRREEYERRMDRIEAQVEVSRRRLGDDPHPSRGR